MLAWERNAGGVPLRVEWRQLGRLFLEGLVAGALTSVVLGLAVFVVAAQAHAAPPGDVRRGTLFLQDGDGRVAAPLVFTDVRLDVSGMTARARVAQRFVNPTGEWREGVYVFPLPEKAAVDHLVMRIGERVIAGEIRERADARRSYEAAKADGRKATLVEQERPNLFTTSVAHIGPDEEITVEIEYQQTLAYDAGSFTLRFPLALTPRYVPGVPLAVLAAAHDSAFGTGYAVATDAVPDADRITPPFADPGEGAINPVSLEVRLHPGFPLARLASLHHAVRVEETNDHRYTLTLADGVVPADRDFELTWTPDVGAAPGAALLTEQRDGRTYALLMVLPPHAAPPATRPPREVTFVVDTSGSMEGVSIAQAKEALRFALDRLAPGDRFNVIEFNASTRALYSAPMPVDPATLRAARAFVGGLKAGGGTEMLPALTAALAAPRQGPEMRQVVFLTDGAVGDENRLLELIERRLDDRRLFTIGIGPAPNTYFLRKAAEAGRGTFTFVGDVREVGAKMTALLRKIEYPVLTDINVAWPGGVLVQPGTPPDLYAGEPVLLTAQLEDAGTRGTVTLTGVRAGAPWTAQLALAGGTPEPGIAVLWARDRIEALLDAKRNGAPADEIRRAVIAVALEHHLVSAYTSLVAVDVTPTAPAGAASVRAALPVNLPQGWSSAAIVGGVPATATPAPLMLRLGGALLVVAAGVGLWLRRRERAAGSPNAEAAVRAARSVC